MMKHRGTACVEFEMPAPASVPTMRSHHRQHAAAADGCVEGSGGGGGGGDARGIRRVVAYRLARIEYRMDSVGWWRIGHEGETDGDECRTITLRLSQPPALTSGGGQSTHVHPLSP